MRVNGKIFRALGTSTWLAIIERESLVFTVPSAAGAIRLRLFWNSIGVLFPEAVDGYKASGMPKLAMSSLRQAHASRPYFSSKKYARSAPAVSSPWSTVPRLMNVTRGFWPVVKATATVSIS